MKFRSCRQKGFPSGVRHDSSWHLRWRPAWHGTLCLRWNGRSLSASSSPSAPRTAAKPQTPASSLMVFPGLPEPGLTGQARQMVKRLPTVPTLDTGGPLGGHHGWPESERSRGKCPANDRQHRDPRPLSGSGR